MSTAACKSFHTALQIWENTSFFFYNALPMDMRKKTQSLQHKIAVLFTFLCNCNLSSNDFSTMMKAPGHNRNSFESEKGIFANAKHERLHNNRHLFSMIVISIQGGYACFFFAQLPLFADSVSVCIACD